ncbi:MAG: response regulator [candidate division KSB1 bacterium]|nr:response regulator [candidate division KSB1 bacterium]MDQ7063492.1 response regulator [candidate division KSB1 bacterium]
MNRIIILNEELESQMRMYLSLCDRYRVEIAEDEANLMRMIRRKNPKLVFIDADYSGFNGNGKTVFKTIQKIKKKYKDLKVVAIMQSNDRKMLEKVHEVGGDGVLLRPIHEDEVLESVDRILPSLKSVFS